jgi:hypothetical protein
MEDEGRMKTYVAEINGEAIIAFRAEDDDDAYAIVNEEDGGLQAGLNGFSGLVREDGLPLWGEQSEIKSRRATDEEHQRWLKVSNASKLMVRKMGDDPDDLSVYLIPTRPVEDEDEDAA